MPFDATLRHAPLGGLDRTIGCVVLRRFLRWGLAAGRIPVDHVARNWRRAWDARWQRWRGRHGREASWSGWRGGWSGYRRKGGLERLGLADLRRAGRGVRRRGGARQGLRSDIRRTTVPAGGDPGALREPLPKHLRQHAGRLECGSAALGYGPLPGPDGLQHDVRPVAHRWSLRRRSAPRRPMHGRAFAVGTTGLPRRITAEARAGDLRS